MGDPVVNPAVIAVEIRLMLSVLYLEFKYPGQKQSSEQPRQSREEQDTTSSEPLGSWTNDEELYDLGFACQK